MKLGDWGRSSLNWVRQHPYHASSYATITIAILSVGTVFLINTIRKTEPAPDCQGLNCVTDKEDAERQKQIATTVSPSPSPTPMAENLLNGQLIALEKANLRPLAVMIENSPDARPQSGLGSADIVYEAIAEGGITRFMAVYADPTTPVKVGPVRSARTYFVDFAAELHALYAHVGGNILALEQLRNQKEVGNLDQFSIGSPTFQREYDRNVAVEHTMYSSTEKIWAIATERKYSLTADVLPWKFSTSPPTSTETATNITIDFSTPSFQVNWQYEAASQSYTRYLAGKVHTDRNSGNAIQAHTIILQTVKNTPIVGSDGKEVWQYTLTGTGTAKVIRDGLVIPATWKRTGTERTRYYSESGDEINLATGQIWVEVVHSSTGVSIN